LVIDLSGDFRLNSADDYEKWYNFSHSKEKLLKIKNYALADLPDTKYGSKLISNPGCYPTAVSLALIPFVNEYSDIIESISVSAYSGISGAGSKPSAKLLFGEISGNVYAYKINKHQHEPEIVQTLQKYGMNCNFSFTTHILPVFAGIYSTATIFLKDENKDNFTELYNEYYSNSHFVRIKDEAPQLKHVVDTNFCDININADGSRVIITSAIDNLIKGAAGQAVQNMNRHFGWDEKLGLINY